METVESDEAMVRRQLSCAHGSEPNTAFIQRSLSETARCVHCGVSEKELSELQAAVITKMWSGHP